MLYASAMSGCSTDVEETAEEAEEEEEEAMAFSERRGFLAQRLAAEEEDEDANCLARLK